MSVRASMSSQWPYTRCLQQRVGLFDLKRDGEDCGADGQPVTDENLDVLKNGCFKYFLCGGQCVEGPVSMLSA